MDLPVPAGWERAYTSRSEEFPAPPFPASVPAMLAYAAQAWGGSEAIVQGARRLTYADLDAETGRLARSLLARGIGKGSRVGLVMPNCPDFAVAFFALTRIGAVAVPMSTLYQAPELAWAIRHADVGWVIAASGYLRNDYVQRLEAALPELAGQTSPRLRLRSAPFLRGILIWGGCDRPWAECWPDSVLAAEPVSAAVLAAAEAEVVPADELFLLYTSGSTAEPKGVAHRHGATIRHSYALGRRGVPLRAGDRIVTGRPFFWVAGLTGTIFYSFLSGVTIICPASNHARDVLAAVEGEGVTAITGREAWMAQVAEDPAFTEGRFLCRRLSWDHSAVAVRDDAEPHGFRYVNPRFEEILPRHRAALGPEDVVRFWGMTETCGTATTRLDNHEVPPGKAWTTGYVVPEILARVVDPVTRQDVPRGEVGEILVHGPHMMSGLYKRERAAVFETDGAYATGDLGRADEDGYFWIEGRLGDMVKVKGANVSPAEVERWLTAMPGVMDVMVLGLPPDAKEPILAAMVIAAREHHRPEADVAAELKTKLSSYKVPSRIVWLEPHEAPRSGSGKLLKRDVAARLMELLQIA